MKLRTTAPKPHEGTARHDRRFGLSRKLGLAFGAVTVLLVVLGVVAITTSSTLHRGSERLADRDVATLEWTSALTTRTGEAMVSTASLTALRNNPTLLREQIAGLPKFDDEIARLTGQISSAEDDNETLVTAAQSFGAAYASYAKARDTELVPHLKAGRFDAADAVVHQRLDGLADGVWAAANTLAGTQRSAAVETRASVTSSFRSGLYMIIGLTIAGLLLATLLAVGMSHRLNRRLRRLRVATQAIADGDFAHRADVQSRDELEDMATAFNLMAQRLEESRAMEETARQEGRRAMASMYESFARRVAQGDLTARIDSDNPEFASLAGNMNEMVQGLGGLSGEVRDATRAITGATTQILSVVSQHNAASAEQAASIAQTTVTVDEVRATAQQAAERAQSLADQARNAAAVSDEGQAAISTITDGMTEIRARVEEIARDILTLSDRTQAIEDITQTVNDLADQSNMLALNATIEAAKAGEHGRGFAVVANEVRLLAEQSKAATARVREILSEIQAASEKAVMATEAGTRVVEAGAAGARDAGQAIARISSTVQETALVATQIAAAAKEQSVGMEQIGQAMTDVASTTNQIATGADQTQHAARGLAELAARLDQLTSRYVLAGAETPTPEMHETPA